MGFWNVVGTIGKFVFSVMEDFNRSAAEQRAKAEEQRARIDLTKNQFENRDNRDLVETVKSKGFFGANDIERRAAFEVLKERGVIRPKHETHTEADDT